MSDKPAITIGRAEKVSFPEQELTDIPARIDTGAKTSAIWGSAHITDDGQLAVAFFDAQSPLYTGQVLPFAEYERIAVANSTGHVQERYKVRLLVRLDGRKIRAWFTLADRSTQVYPVLIGRNVLRGKFIVDVKKGDVLYAAERARAVQLQSHITNPQQESK